MYTYVLHDTRLKGSPLINRGMVFTLNTNRSLRATLQRLRGMATSGGSGRIGELQVMCHGLAGGVHDSLTRESTSALGFGLQLGQEGLNLSNLSMTGIIADVFPIILLYACGPAHTRAGFSMTVADGRRFCQELAGFTNSEVIAASQTQYYRHGKGVPINFGDWEGQVYRFSPDGSVMPHTAPAHVPGA